LPQLTDCSGQSRAVVLANDEALRLSLVFLLEMCGLEAVGVAGVDELLACCRLDDQLIFVDCTLGGISGASVIEELRRGGWRGNAVIMAERERSHDVVQREGVAHVLVKPFSAEDVLEVIGRKS
jgi:FixJ family two-component response regulator